jgi:hypothetical protein
LGGHRAEAALGCVVDYFTDSYENFFRTMIRNNYVTYTIIVHIVCLFCNNYLSDYSDCSISQENDSGFEFRVAPKTGCVRPEKSELTNFGFWNWMRIGIGAINYKISGFTK